MKIGIMGLPQAGRKTLFTLLTGAESKIASSGREEIRFGTAVIKDSRFDQLTALYKPRKSVPAALESVLLPGFDKETLSSGECFRAIEKCDALCLVVRAFRDEAVFHVDGSVDPLRDVEKVVTELVLSDLILIEKRLERLDKEVRIKSDPAQVREKNILSAMKAHLEGHRPLLTFPLTPDEKKLMSTYQFLTQRPLIVVLNVDDDKLHNDGLLTKVHEKYPESGLHVMQISAKIESELNSLAPQEKEAFMQDLKITESALLHLSRLCFETLGLISFFTVGEDEVRQWTTRKGSSAPEAAGVIHSDLQRGFIRAEIMRSGELITAKSEAKLKEEGKVSLKGKEYILEDGDIMHVRFNV